MQAPQWPKAIAAAASAAASASAAAAAPAAAGAEADALPSGTAVAVALRAFAVAFSLAGAGAGGWEVYLPLSTVELACCDAAPTAERLLLRGGRETPVVAGGGGDEGSLKADVAYSSAPRHPLLAATARFAAALQAQENQGASPAAAVPTEADGDGALTAIAALAYSQALPPPPHSPPTGHATLATPSPPLGEALGESFSEAIREALSQAGMTAASEARSAAALREAVGRALACGAQAWARRVGDVDAGEHAAALRIPQARTKTRTLHAGLGNGGHHRLRTCCGRLLPLLTSGCVEADACAVVLALAFCRSSRWTSSCARPSAAPSPPSPQWRRFHPHRGARPRAGPPGAATAV